MALMIRGLQDLTEDSGMSRKEWDIWKKVKPYEERIAAACSEEFLEAFLSLYNQAWALEAGDAFEQGFRLGARLMAEVFEEP